MSKVKTQATPGFGAYHEQVNIALFNDIVAFIMDTTTADAAPTRKKLNSGHLWYKRSDNNNIQAQFGFRYLGELLERYEAKAGSDIRDIRAIALAMAGAKELLTDSMFVGSQKAGFLKKIKAQSAGDIYLKGALYLLNRYEPAGDALYEELTRGSYSQTEELIFVASLLERFEQMLKCFKPQLINLLGAGRTIPAFGNTGIYAWLITRIHEYNSETGIRGKDMGILRALLELPVSYVKAGNKYHDTLLAGGYTHEEIVYLNIGVIHERPVPETLEPHSIVTEKIAIDYCKTFVNSENTHHEDAYNLLEYLLERYADTIKISGYSGIFEAIKEQIEIVNPRTFLRLYNYFFTEQKNAYENGQKLEALGVFRFDISDDKWDILSLELSAEAYLGLFERQMRNAKDPAGETVRAWIEKYGALTGKLYLAVFEQEHTWSRDRIFTLFVEKGIIDLQAVFESCPGKDEISDTAGDKEKPQIFHYLQTYLKGIRHRKAFDFFRYFLKKHSFEDMQRFFTDGSNAYGGYRKDRSYFFPGGYYKGFNNSYTFSEESNSRYYSPHNRDEKDPFDIKREFLTDDEHRELFGWVDDYMYQYKADEYVEFAALALLDSFVKNLFPQTEMREAYDLVKDTDSKTVNTYAHLLKKAFWTEEELQAERAADEARKKERERREKEQTLQSLSDQAVKLYDGTIGSILKFIGKAKWNNRDEAIRIAVQYLKPTLASVDYELSMEEIADYLTLCGKLLPVGAISLEEFKETTIMIKEAAKNAEFTENTGDGDDIGDDEEDD